MNFLADLRYAARTLLARPGLTLAVLLTLGPGLGGAVVVFELLNLLAWQPAPVERPREVVALYTANPQGPYGLWGPSSYEEYLDYRQAAGLGSLVASTASSVELAAGEAAARRVETVFVTGDYFAALGLATALGRPLEAADDAPAAAPAGVIGFGLWQRLFAADPGVVGRTVRVDGHPFTLVGVLEEGFAGVQAGSRPELFLPMARVGEVASANPQWLTDPRQRRFDLLGRLAPGASLAAVREELRQRAAVLDRERPVADFARRITVLPAARLHPAEQRELAPAVGLLAAAMGVLLFIACANVAQLLLALAVSRAREAGIRRALGARASRLLSRSLAEGTLLAVGGGVLGLLLAVWARRLLAVHLGARFVDELHFDLRVLGLAALSVGGVALFLSLMPALLQLRAGLAQVLQAGRQGGLGVGFGGRRWQLPGLLVAAQVALAALLLASTALAAQSLWNLRGAGAGFDGENLVYTTVWARPKRLPDMGRELYRQAAERAAALPGVASAGKALQLPPIAADLSIRLRLEEAALAPEAGLTSRFNAVDGEYFAALGLPLVAGRVFESRDDAQAPAVVVVNEALAERLWPGRDPLGRTVWVEPERPWDAGPAFEVVGVVRSIRQYDPRQAAEPVLYFSYEQRFRPILHLAVRSQGDPAPVMAALRREIRALDPQLETLEVRAYGDHVWENLGRERLLTEALGTFAALGWFLAVVGVAGMMSYLVSRTVREIGIRMALGADRRRILAHVLGRGLGLTVAGLVAGLGAAWLAAHALRHHLFGIAPEDPLTLAAVAALLLASAAAAAFLPARRAMRVDPLAALRQD